ncbi:MAG: hypothetical protein KME15_26620 [Drouetiella hepatica Uher 2000/2452]|jgi:Trk K+ transport system NAD-binding subunit|uniref:RCK C-terminal domain-containing protein n=1 Tax=Drouetiella hepatica Uher 2000/2452 TaxID=904376 RepID=A0A951US74_9CYAN|nr:hypothetical protein [Drouetiella hepatica Uher 2000/2452]
MFKHRNFNESNLVEVTITFSSYFCGIALSDIAIPEFCVVLGLVRGGEVILASAQPRVHCGDHVLAIALNPTLIPALKVALRKTHLVRYTLQDCQI